MSQSKTKKIISAVLGALLGVFFIFSAWTKTYPIQDFEYIISSQLDFSKTISALIARVVIGIEITLGLFLILHFLLKKKWIIYSSILLMIAFSIHLLILYFNQGNDVNCGCMGTFIEMSPIPSILKNLGLIVLLIILLVWIKGLPIIKLNNLFIILIGLLTVGTIFIIFPNTSPEFLSYHKIYDPKEPQQPKVNLKEGKHVVAFMTLGCGHCRDAAKEVAVIKKEYPDIPFYFIFMQPQDTTNLSVMEQDFFEDTKTTDVPYSYLNGETFIGLIHESGNSGTPVILWMKDSTIVREISNHNINAKDIQNWLTNNQP